MLIRPAHYKDLPEIVEIYNLAIPGRQATSDLEPVTVEQRQAWFLAHNPSSCPLWVATNNEQVIGWLSLEKFKSRAAYGQTRETSVYVHPDFHQQGVATQLMENMLQYIPKLNVHAIVTLIFTHNIPSIKLFQKYDFNNWGELPEVTELDGIKRNVTILGKIFNRIN